MFLYVHPLCRYVDDTWNIPNVINEQETVAVGVLLEGAMLEYCRVRDEGPCKPS